MDITNLPRGFDATVLVLGANLKSRAKCVQTDNFAQLQLRFVDHAQVHGGGRNDSPYLGCSPASTRRRADVG
jgi:hypothetical protein